MPTELAKKFAEYISDDLPPEIQAPDAIELGNALIAAETEIERLRDLAKADQKFIADVNNSIWGSQAYFIHPETVSRIEDLKASSNRAPFTPDKGA